MVLVVEATQDGDRDDRAIGIPRPAGRVRRGRHALAEPLMGPGVVEVPDVLAQDAAQVPLAEDQDVVEAFPPDAPEEALADGVGPRRARRAQGPDAADRGDPSDVGPELPVVVGDQEAVSTPPA